MNIVRDGLTESINTPLNILAGVINKANSNRYTPLRISLSLRLTPTMRRHKNAKCINAN